MITIFSFYLTFQQSFSLSVDMSMQFTDQLSLFTAVSKEAEDRIGPRPGGCPCAISYEEQKMHVYQLNKSKHLKFWLWLMFLSRQLDIPCVYSVLNDEYLQKTKECASYSLFSGTFLARVNSPAVSFTSFSTFRQRPSSSLLIGLVLNVACTVVPIKH